ncbi:M15 family metallopeptidase [Promicromonospora kroppenstedtii]|uniref:M15 family metallopeptidase n=1 Tax=Promicromonospora kroppenstedtii TaxID=440482 RepID=A0ABW7XFT5_9MICO
MTRQELAHPPAYGNGPARHVPRPARRRSGRPVAFLLVAAAVVLVAVFGVYPLLDRTDQPVVQAVDRALDAARSSDAATGVAGGDIPDGAATLDDDLPAITGLDAALTDAVRAAADDAAADGIDFWVTSGWRSPAYQQRLLDDAVRTYGSLDAARERVSTPELSEHVHGKAIDIGPTEGAYWLIQHGPEYGLCQVYSNEIWHFELLTQPGGTCPALLENAGG